MILKKGLIKKDKKMELYKAHDFCASGEAKLTVIMIHGIATDSSSYSKALTYLEGTTSMKDVRFIAFDLLGAGKSLTSDKLEYNFSEQLSALESSIKKLDLKTPVVLVGHSMGTMILARYLANHKRGIKKVILLSPPIYRKEEIEHPAFKQAMEGFFAYVKQKSADTLKAKYFTNAIDNIVLNKNNYGFFEKISKPTVMIYGEEDTFIAPHNIVAVAKVNPNIDICCTPCGHSISHEKYTKVLNILEGIINETV